jgi:hypothetical protein
MMKSDKSVVYIPSRTGESLPQSDRDKMLQSGRDRTMNSGRHMHGVAAWQRQDTSESRRHDV